MIKLSDKSSDTGLGGYVYGMNTADKAKDLSHGECQQLENTTPAETMVPRTGLVDLFYNSTALGQHTEHTQYGPNAVLMNNPFGIEYAIAFCQNIISTDTFLLEAIKTSDGTRSVIMAAKFASTTAKCSMLKIYGSIYCAFDTAITTNYTNSYLTKNVIIYWDSITSAWVARGWGLDIDLTLNAINIEDNATGAGSSDRAGFGIVNTGSTILIHGGMDAVGRKLDVISTLNMTNWTAKTVEAYEYLMDEGGEILIDEPVNGLPWIARDGNRMIEYAGKIWMMGGQDADGNYLNDLWYTEDGGTTWVRHITNCDWAARTDFALVVFANKIFLLGGYIYDEASDEIWTFDGTTWTEVTPTGFSARYGHEALVYDSKIWVIMGASATDVINSTDGTTWSSVAADAGLGARVGFGAVVHDSKMWVTGGYNGAARLQDVRYSTDGITWSTATATASWTARSAHSTVSFAGKLWVVCGYDGASYLDDIWSSEDGATWASAVGGLTKDHWYGYAYTAIRREDSLSKLSSMLGYNYEPWETYLGYTLVGIDEKLLTGTVSLSGTALTGVSTAFDTELAAGDRIRIDGTYRYYTVTTVTDASNIVVENADGDSYSGKEFALLPADGGPITTDDFNPGIDESPEQTTKRQLVYCSSSTDYGRAMIPMPIITEAVAKGATHLRIYRTIAADTAVIAAGLPFKWLVDVSISGDSYGLPNFYRDLLSDTVLESETNVIETNGYEVAPAGRFCVWDRERVWLSIGDGFWLYSVGASQDVEYPQKYASLFNGSTQRSVCDPEDGQKDNGAAILSSDLYLFKERKIHLLDSADPNNVPRSVSEGIGCDFPNTITYIDHPQYKKAILFLSTEGPAVLRAGGVVELISQFKLAEVWPGGYLHMDQTTKVPRTSEWKEAVTATWYKNAWRIVVPGQTIPTVYCFYVDPNESIFGGFKDTFAPNGAVYPSDPAVLIPKDNSTCYALSSKSSVYRLSHYLKTGTYRDTYSGTTYAYHMKAKNRRQGLDPELSIEAEFSDILFHGNMKDDEGLSMTAYCDGNRFNANIAYSENADTNLEAAGYDYFRSLIQGILEEGCYGRGFDVLVDKTVPSDGDFDFSGVDMNVVPVPEMEAEFQGTSGARAKGWV